MRNPLWWYRHTDSARGRASVLGFVVGGSTLWIDHRNVNRRTGGPGTVHKPLDLAAEGARLTAGIRLGFIDSSGRTRESALNRRVGGRPRGVCDAVLRSAAAWQAGRR